MNLKDRVEYEYYTHIQLESETSVESHLRRDGPFCYYCGQKANRWTLDHVVPKRKQKGLHDNKVLCCHSCNQKKAGDTLIEWLLAIRHDVNRFWPYANMNRIERMRAYNLKTQQADKQFNEEVRASIWGKLEGYSAET